MVPFLSSRRVKQKRHKTQLNKCCDLIPISLWQNERQGKIVLTGIMQFVVTSRGYDSNKICISVSSLLSLYCDKTTLIYALVEFLPRCENLILEAASDDIEDKDESKEDFYNDEGSSPQDVAGDVADRETCHHGAN